MVVRVQPDLFTDGEIIEIDDGARHFRARVHPRAGGVWLSLRAEERHGGATVGWEGWVSASVARAKDHARDLGHDWVTGGVSWVASGSWADSFDAWEIERGATVHRLPQRGAAS
jgi:hypothetical protein